MATLIGVVSQVVGEVFAVASDGSRRPISEGDRVYAGEQLVTGASGAVAIAMTNGQQLTLGRDSSMTLDAQMLESLQTVIDRAAESLAAELRASLSQMVRDVVARAVTEEITRVHAEIARRSGS